MKKVIFLLILIPSLLSALPIDTNVFRYYPLRVGNSWTYYFSHYFSGTFRYKIAATGIMTANGRFYFELTRYRAGFIPLILYERIDSTAGNIRTYTTSNSCLWTASEITGDSLAARRFDSSKYNCFYYYRCTDDTGHSNLFGQYNLTKTFRWTDYFEQVTERIYMQDIGLISSVESTPAGYINTYLLGCVINGIRYGDTNLIGITQISFNNPENYSLSQNYPNPFNPMTNVKFQMPKAGFVKLIIYDVLGKEITQLVNQQMQAGSYNVDWDAANYPSGVYFYKLVVGDNTNNGGFVETKKMVLVK